MIQLACAEGRTTLTAEEHPIGTSAIFKLVTSSAWSAHKLSNRGPRRNPTNGWNRSTKDCLKQGSNQINRSCIVYACKILGAGFFVSSRRA